MNPALLLVFGLAIVAGIISGIQEMNAVKRNPSLGVKKSKNLWTFLFEDSYE
jgi:hypothetical protein